MTEPFRLGAVPALSRSTVDRNESLRADPERLYARWPDARVILVDRQGRAPVPVDAVRASAGDASSGSDADSNEADGNEAADSSDAAGSEAEAGIPLASRTALDFGELPPEEASFLGEWHGADYWMLPDSPPEDAGTVTVDGGWGVRQEAPATEDEAWLELRGHGSLLDDTSAGLLTTAEALRNWHRRARFCARCGTATRRALFGWSTWCPSCEREEYPRTDPAVICLVHDDIGVNGEHVLLARQPVWPPQRFSVLAGFVEAGESLEGCVEREIREEVAVEVRDIRYLGSQPWPFPRSIMLGFTARADAGAELVAADGEIEEARWVSRADLRAAFAGDNPDLLIPGSSSIAYVMLRAWAHAQP